MLSLPDVAVFCLFSAGVRASPRGVAVGVVCLNATPPDELARRDRRPDAGQVRRDQ